MSASTSVEGARAVREEDAFDVAAVARWIRGRANSAVLAGVDLGTDAEPVVPEVRQFSGGASNLTYLLRYPGRDLILRRPPVGTKARGAHDMRREYEVQDALRPAFPLVPRMVGLCTDETVLGSEFYVMERLEGTILRTEMPTGLGLDASTTRELCQRAVDILADLHAVDVDAAGLGGLGKGPGYVGRQVSGWSRRYRDARTPDVPDFEPVMAWLDAEQPGDVAQCLVHNDFRFDNLVLAPDDPTRVVGVLDWEMATVGDPLMDLGGALAYWVQADDDPLMKAFRRQPTHAPGMFTRAEVVERYCRRAGIDMTNERWRFYEVFGLFRLAVIIQQIHYRYFHGQTTNPAYRMFRLAVVVLEQRCLRLIRQGSGGGVVGRARGTVADRLRVVRPLAVGTVAAARRRVGRPAKR